MNGGLVRGNLRRGILDARRRSDELFALVRTESLYERPIPERHRIVFYIGHLEAFDWNLLRENVGALPSFDPALDRLFAFGIDPVGGGLPSDQPADWPALHEVREYVAEVRAALDSELSRESLAPRAVQWDGVEMETLLWVALEHRLMHVETLAYMLHQMSPEKKVWQPGAKNVERAAVVPRMVEVPAGTATLGLHRSQERFGWDNEYEAHVVEVPAFAVDLYKVTNRQYLDFINAGGYGTRGWWSEDDWNWINARGISHPVFWKKADGGWWHRGMFEEVPLPMDWPVYVSHAEASAYARWAGKSLPTEAELHRAAYGNLPNAERNYPWGNEAPDSSRGNFDLQRWDPAPVDAFPGSRSAFGVQDILGNGWEWTSTPFAPFAGFEPFPFYRGYSADFFDGKHFVMKGGSSRTAACLLRPTFRNWFQAHYQYAYTGFRCVSR
jgi:ergothioneine biosynthesis protein EgtB